MSKQPNAKPARSWFLSLLVVLALLPLAADQPPEIHKYTDIHAGAIVAGASAGTITLAAPSGNLSSTGGTILGNPVGSTLGSLTLEGKEGNTWAVSMGSVLPFLLSRVGGETLTVTAVDFQPSATRTGLFPHSGTTSKYFLGVTLSVGPNASTPHGIYSGSFLLVLNDTSKGGKRTTQAFTVTVRVEPVITLARTADLAFGDIFTASRAGKVVLSPSGGRVATGGLLLGSINPATAASFAVSGAPNTTYAILLPGSVTLTGPDGSMQVKDFTSSVDDSGLLSAAGKQPFSVGATLHVAADQPVGVYRGTFAVTVTYN
jgi:hypothetical protein